MLKNILQRLFHEKWKIFQSLLDLKMIPQKMKEKIAPVTQRMNAVNMLFTWFVPSIKLLLSASFNHTKKIQPISTIYMYLNCI